MKFNYKPSRKAQRGFTLIEVVIAISVAAVLAVASSYGAKYLRLQATAASWAPKITQMNDALNSYTTANFIALTTGAAVSGVATPLSPTVAELVSLGNLPSNYSNTSLPGVSLAYSLALSPSGCSSPSCDVAWTIWTTSAPTSSDGKTTDMQLVAVTAKNVARDAGWSPLDAPTTIYGTGASWSMTNPMGSVAGIIAIRSNYTSSQFTNFIRQNETRDVNLNAALAVGGTTTLTGSLTARGAITATSTINASGAITSTGGITATGGTVTNTLKISVAQTKGEACPGVGYVATDSSGNALVCVGGVWVSGASLDGIGTAGLMKAYLGKSASCSGVAYETGDDQYTAFTALSKVDSSGNVYTRVYYSNENGSGDSGWVSGSAATSGYATATISIGAVYGAGWGVYGGSATCIGTY